MRTINYIVRIKPIHNPPVFNPEMGQGVVAIQPVVYRTMSHDDELSEWMDTVAIADAINKMKEQLLNEYFEVIVQDAPND